jgi:hypothetical protein
MTFELVDHPVRHGIARSALRDCFRVSRRRGVDSDSRVLSS